MAKKNTHLIVRAFCDNEDYSDDFILACAYVDLDKIKVDLRKVRDLFFRMKKRYTKLERMDFSALIPAFYNYIKVSDENQDNLDDNSSVTLASRPRTRKKDKLVLKHARLLVDEDGFSWYGIDKENGVRLETKYVPWESLS